jgi:hypothetical protein
MPKVRMLWIRIPRVWDRFSWMRASLWDMRGCPKAPLVLGTQPSFRLPLLEE